MSIQNKYDPMVYIAPYDAIQKNLDDMGNELDKLIQQVHSIMETESVTKENVEYIYNEVRRVVLILGAIKDLHALTAERINGISLDKAKKLMNSMFKNA